MISKMLSRIGASAMRYAEAIDPWTNVYGIARSMVAAASALTLLSNSPTTLFYPVQSCEAPRGITLFCMVPGHLQLARWVAIAVLAIVATGWRPRFTGVFHWWITLSLRVAIPPGDGGDEVASTLTLLMLLICLTDDREWHWLSRETRLPATSMYSRIVGISALLIVQLQISGLYLQSFVAKLSVDEWADGTALYYWLNHPLIGAPQWAMKVLTPLIMQPTLLFLMTWGVLLTEFALFLGLFLSQRARRYLLVLGLCFHAAIGLCFGISSFVVCMWGALIIYLGPMQHGFSFSPLKLAWAKPMERRRYSKVEEERVGVLSSMRSAIHRFAR